MKGFFVALQFLTIFRCRGAGAATAPAAIGESSAFFPIVGLFLGGILLVCNELLESRLPAPLLGIVLTALLIAMTRGFHLDGLADTFDALGARGGQEEAHRAMRDSRTGVFGVLALITVVALKFKCLEILDDARAEALLLSPAVGRWAMVLLAFRSRSPRQGLGRIVIEAMKPRHFIFASAATLAAAWAISGRSGLLVLSAALVLACGARIYFHRRLGGITGDTCGAMGEMAETLSLAALAVLKGQRA